YDVAAGTGGNNTQSKASTIPQVSGSIQLLAVGDLTTAADVDYYKFTISAVNSLTPVVVRLKATGQSLLTPRITVLNSSGGVVASADSNDPLHNDLAIQFNSALLGGTYYVKVEKASDGGFGSGAYLLAVDRGLLNLLAPLVNLLTGV